MIKHRTTEWYKARIGKFTASNFPDIMTKPADKSASVSKTALNCIEKAAAELFFNSYLEKPDSDSTRWGLIYEETAIKQFSERTKLVTKDCGFMLHPKYPDVGATPDALIEDETFVDKTIIAQIKCPYNSKYHGEYRQKISDGVSLKKSKSDFFWQIQGEIWVTDAIHSYFVSFDPRENSTSNLHIVKINRDDEAISLLEQKILEAIKLRDQMVDEFRKGVKRPKRLDQYW